MLGKIFLFNGAVDPQGQYPYGRVTLPLSAPDFSRENRYWEFALYANDTWSVNSRLKVNLGLRYEYFGPQRNTDRSLDSNFYPGTGSNIFEQTRSGSVQLAPDSPVGELWAASKANFAPRVGFAWDVTGDGRTSLRGGYGIGYERNFGNVTFNVIQNPPNYGVLSFTSSAAVTYPIYVDNLGPLTGTGTRTMPTVTLRAVNPNIKQAYAHFWSLSLQHELTRNTIALLEYTGSAGRNQYDIYNTNRPFAGDQSGTLPSDLAAMPNSLERPNPQYGNINFRDATGQSMYHGATVGIDARRLGNTGLSLTARYTLSHVQDYLSSAFSESNSNFNLGYLDALDPALDKGDADFDVRHRAVVSGIWEIPMAKEATGVKKTLLNGWQVNWIFTAQSGTPFTISDCTNGYYMCARMNKVAPINSYIQTPVDGGINEFNYLDISNQTSGAGSIMNEYSGTNEIAPEGGYPSSMSKRNEFRKPGRYNIDLSLAKRFKVSERVGLQLRLEAYNLLNHANLYVVDDAADISGTEMITAVRGSTSSYGLVGDGQRRLQLGAKIEF
jgi:hypothetical protein